MIWWHGMATRLGIATEQREKEDVPAKSTIVSANVLCVSSGVEV